MNTPAIALLLSLALPPTPQETAAGAAGLSLDDAVRELSAFVERQAAEDAFAGTVLLARDGEVVLEGTWGLASRRFGVPNRIDTKFNLGSMNKMFTSVAILQLVQDEKLSLDDPIGMYLDESWLPFEVADRIQVKHLLTHTSGLGSYFTQRFMDSSRALYRELDDYKPLVHTATLAFEPGTSWSYSNTGMFLLGPILENVMGTSYFDHVKKHVHEPAGMTDTDCYEMDRPVENLAIGYTRDEEGGWRNNLYMHVIKGGPAGGGFSTAHDLLRFDQALRDLVLLDQEHTELLWSAKPELGSPSYGFGFSIGGDPGNRIVGHGGGFPGISSNLDMYLDTGYTAVVLSNVDGGAPLVNQKIRELLRRVEG